jgi:hypothetical protein
MKGLFRKGCVTVGAVVALAGAAPSIASADPCPSNSLSQPFLAWGDTNEYTLLPGESVDNVTGDGWELWRGANLATTSLEDGQVGQVLDMPAGSVAVTPPMCVNASAYPMARTMVQDVSGTEGVAVYVAYDGPGAGDWPFAAGNIKNTVPGWAPSKPIMLHAGQLRGQHTVRLILVSYGGDYQLYNFYIDPRRSH